VYSWSFEGNSAVLINPSKENPSGYIEQCVTGVSNGMYELYFDIAVKRIEQAYRQPTLMEAACV
ncbi:MAG: hypothetical protein LBD79_10535, partial [Treponema sp.]|nr:hypothetical protein [Treponema sp.]